MIRARGDQPRQTVEDFMKLPEGTRAELIDEEIFMSPSLRPRHQRVPFRLSRILDEHITRHGLGEIFIAPLDVHLPSEDIVEPDVFFIAKENAGIVQDWVRGVPDLIIEMLSPDRPDRDRIVKRDLYAHNGVREYWLVGPETKTIEVFSLQDDQYKRSGCFGAGETLTSPLLAGLQVLLALVFET